MEALLQKIQQRLQHRDAPQLECWLQNVDLAQELDGQLALICPNVFSKRWLEEKYKAPLEKAIREETGREVVLVFRVESQKPNSSAVQDLPGNAPAPSATCAPADTLPATADGGEIPPFPGWNPPFRFSSFVVGHGNRFAYSAIQEICRERRSRYNPLLVLAGTGLGKTHLGQAAGHLLVRENPGLRVSYCTAEGLFNEMIQNLRSKTISAFKDKYRKGCDVFILDDLQFVLGKDSFQSELCHTLDVLLHLEQRIILLASLPARQVTGLSASLRSRIFSGLVVSIESPDYEMRLELLGRFAQSAGITLPAGTGELLARLVRSDVRDLKGVFQRVLALHSLLRHPIDPETLEAHFKDLAIAHRSPNLADIRRHVAQYFGLSPDDLSSHSRQRKVAYPRQISMYLSRKHTRESLEAIGFLYNRDHSSVLYALKSLERKMSRNQRTSREVQFVEERLLEQT